MVCTRQLYRFRCVDGTHLEGFKILMGSSDAQLSRSRDASVCDLAGLCAAKDVKPGNSSAAPSDILRGVSLIFGLALMLGFSYTASQALTH